VEILKHLPRIYSRFRELVREIDRRKPDAAILIDSPAFNLRVARQLHKRGIPVIYFVAPQFWAWRTGRVRFIRRYFDKVLVIFPFEEKFYREHGVDAEYVGHPLADVPPPSITRAEFARQHSLDANKQWIALLPGSRKQEIERNLPEMLRAAQLLGQLYQFLLPVASTLDAKWLEAKIPRAKPGIDIRLVSNAREALTLARTSVVASGTATVGAALAGNPFVVVYRVSPLSFAVGSRLVHVQHFAMPNLIAGRMVVPELIQDDFTAERIAERIRELLPEGTARTQMMADLAGVSASLHGAAGSMTAADRAANAITEMLSRREQPMASARV
jgi:lipid-A-disaccharide synthase